MSVFGAHSGRKRDIAEVPENANSWKSPRFLAAKLSGWASSRLTSTTGQYRRL
jgi:hypothetical protein